MYTISLINEKGGTGKTTTTVNLAAALGEMGHKVLLVDLDGQAASSRWMGVEDDGRLADAIWAGGGLEPIPDVMENVSLAPAHVRLDAVAHDLRPTQGGQLRKVLMEVSDAYDYIIMDCPPSLNNRLIGNALLASTHTIVPVETSILALDGLKILLTTLSDVQDSFGHDVKLLGVVACRFDARTRLSRLVLEELQRTMPGRIFDTVVHENVRVRECPASAKSILDFAPECKACEDFRALAAETIRRLEESETQEDQGRLTIDHGWAELRRKIREQRGTAKTGSTRDLDVDSASIEELEQIVREEIDGEQPHYEDMPEQPAPQAWGTVEEDAPEQTQPWEVEPDAEDEVQFQTPAGEDEVYPPELEEPDVQLDPSMAGWADDLNLDAEQDISFETPDQPEPVTPPSPPVAEDAQTAGDFNPLDLCQPPAQTPQQEPAAQEPTPVTPSAPAEAPKANISDQNEEEDLKSKAFFPWALPEHLQDGPGNDQAPPAHANRPEPAWKEPSDTEETDFLQAEILSEGPGVNSAALDDELAPPPPVDEDEGPDIELENPPTVKGSRSGQDKFPALRKFLKKLVPSE
ncbi:MAG: AAA family ATPase [Phycisphaerae bacterium]